MNTIEEIIEEIRRGRMVIVMDDESRENEGDLVMAASLVRPEDINFMAKYARGLICLTLTRERCQQLRLPLMVQENRTPHRTNFTVSIDAATGITTGISAADRARTIQVAVAPDARPEDLVQPGHVFPLMAQPGGVLSRAGHTEAGCDLVRLAGLEPAAVIVEILNEDGTMARRPELEAFARRHGLKMTTIAELIRYRMEHEQTVERISECDYPTEFGCFRLYAYQDRVDGKAHLALVLGEISPSESVLVRVHAKPLLDDLLAGKREGGITIRQALAAIARAGKGICVVLRNEEESRAFLERIHHYQLQDSGLELSERSPSEEWRMTGIGAQILRDLGARKLRVLGTPRRFHGLSGFGLEIVDYVTPEEITESKKSIKIA